MLVINTSILTGKEHTMEIDVDPAKLYAWSMNPDRSHVQNEFPELSAEEREFIYSGITPEEWKEMFG